MKGILDVIIIGGGASGLSAALVLGRVLRKTLVLHTNEPCNKVANKSHGFLTQDGKAPAEINAAALKDVAKYDSVEIKQAEVVAVTKTETGFKVETSEGTVFESLKIIFANGLTDGLPNIKGAKECWGTSLLHCPYCHGYEYKNQKTGLILDGSSFLGTASVIHNLTKDLTVLTNGLLALSQKQDSLLKQNEIKVIYTRISEIVHENGQVKSVLFEDGNTLDFEVIYTHTRRLYNSDIARILGCTLGENGNILRNGTYKTNINGVFACGDVSGSARSVAVAVASGNLAGMSVDASLASDAFF